MILLRIARSKIGTYLVPWFFTHLSFLLPVKREFESKELLVFHHPWPSYPVHILLVPKKPIAGIDALITKDNELLLEVMKTAQSLVNEFEPVESGYRLILNAGAYQEVPQLHFHLITEQSTKFTKEHQLST